MSPALAGAFFTTEPPRKPHGLQHSKLNLSLDSDLWAQHRQHGEN